jgi:arylmalonate decarboxylase
VLTLFSTAAALSALPRISCAATNEPRKLGLLIPPTGGTLPGEAASMYSSSIEYLIETLGVESMTPDAFEAVLDRIAPNAQKLAARGAEAILLMGTSLSFYQGQAFNEQLTRNLIDSTGLPSMTMSTAVIEGLKAVGATRVTAPTAYNDEVNERLRRFLGEHGFDVVKVQGLGIEAVEDINNVTQPQLLDFCAEVAQSSPAADAILVSCGGLRTLEIVAPLEQRSGRPAVTSMPHALYYGAKLLGMEASVEGYGRLIAM